jgi:hypothetical protein
MRGHRCSPEELDTARTAAREIARGPIQAKLITVPGTGHHPEGWRAFHEEFIAAVLESPQLKSDWLSELRQGLDTARGAVIDAAAKSARGDELSSLCAAWKEELDPRTVWSAREPHVAFHDQLLHMAYLLVSIDTADGLRALETLPCPFLMEQGLHLYFLEDREKIVDLILQAPQVYDESGNWLESRSVTALLAVDLVVAHAQRLEGTLASRTRVFLPAGHDPVQTKRALDEIRRVELPAWMKSVFETVLRRPDGVSVAAAYIGHLSRSAMTDTSPAQTTRDWSVHGAAQAALAAALGAAGADVARLRASWLTAQNLALEKERLAEKVDHVRPFTQSAARPAAGEGARTLRGEGLPYLVGAASVIASVGSPAPASEIDALWLWFDELVRGRDPGLSLVHSGTSLTDVASLLGSLACRTSDPARVVRDTYQALEGSRRRAFYPLRYPEDVDRYVESVIVLRIALVVAACWRALLAEAGSPTTPALDLFYWTFAQARRLWLTTVIDGQESTRQLVSASFCFIPAVFGDAVGDAVGAMIPTIANDTRMLGDACAHLRNNNVEPETIRQLVAAAGADLPAALREAYDWATLTSQPNKFPAHLVKLANEFGLGLEPIAERPRASRS